MLWKFIPMEVYSTFKKHYFLFADIKGSLIMCLNITQNLDI